jgi:hypothetical protein
MGVEKKLTNLEGPIPARGIHSGGYLGGPAVFGKWKSEKIWNGDFHWWDAMRAGVAVEALDDGMQGSRWF